VLKVKYEDFCDNPTSFLDIATQTLNQKYGINRHLTRALPTTFGSASRGKNSEDIKAINIRLEEIKAEGLK
jgi:hypothetical protein